MPEPTDDPVSSRLYHGTKAYLTPGDLIRPGYASNYGTRKEANFVYLTATIEAAAWGAELALGDGPGGEILEWQRHSPEALKAMTDHLERLKELGIEAIQE